MAVNIKSLQKVTSPFQNSAPTVVDADAAAKQKLAQLRVQQENQKQTPSAQSQALAKFSNTGSTFTSSASPSKPATAPVVNNAPKQSYADKAQELYDMMRNRATQPVKEFSYNAGSDPAYQAALKRAQANIEQGNSAAQAEMNRRGILNSTITSDRMGEISSNEMGRVETDVLPSLMQAAYQRYADQLAQEQQQFNNLGSLYGMNISEDQRGFDNKVTESGLTGNYLPAGAQEAIDNILQLKQQAEQKGLTAAERANLSARADGYRAQLSSMGIDPSFYAANVNSKQASQNNPALRTLQGQQLDMQKQAANWGAAQSVWDASGRLVNPQSDWTGLLRQVQSGKAPQTMAAQQQQFNNNLANRQQNFNEGQQQIDNQFRNEQFAYQKARDGISDAQWKAQFDRDVQQFGLNYALQKLSEENQQAYREAQTGMARDELNYRKEVDAVANGKGTSAEDYAKYIDSAVTYDDNKKITNQMDIEKMILSSGLSEAEMKKLYVRYGLTLPAGN